SSNAVAVGCWDGRVRLVELPSVATAAARPGAPSATVGVLAWHATHVHALAATTEDPVAARMAAALGDDGNRSNRTEASNRNDEDGDEDGEEGDLISELAAWQAPKTSRPPVLLATASQDGRIALWQVP